MRKRGRKGEKEEEGGKMGRVGGRGGRVRKEEMRKGWEKEEEVGGRRG